MHPLTVTWAPTIYTDWGLRNFHRWIDAGHDNYLNTPNGKVHRLLSRLSVESMLHPFQPFILGQKTLAAKMAGIKWIYTKKNMSWQGPSYRGWEFRSWLSDGIIAQNSDMMNDFFPGRKNVKLIPIGIDSPKYKLDKKNKSKIKWFLAFFDQKYSEIVLFFENIQKIKLSFSPAASRPDFSKNKSKKSKKIKRFFDLFFEYFN